jgi:hypothetical protein
MVRVAVVQWCSPHCETAASMIKMREFSMLVFVAFAATSPPAHAADDWNQDWTVVTMAHNGSWGIGTHRSVTSALARAIDECRAMSTETSDCGAESVSSRGGWILGLRCGDYMILASANDLKDAEAAALYREIDLRELYVHDLSSCRRVLTVNPHGVATAADARLSTRHQ